jgi:hypothetical protein
VEYFRSENRLNDVAEEAKDLEFVEGGREEMKKTKKCLINQGYYYYLFNKFPNGNAGASTNTRLC